MIGINLKMPKCCNECFACEWDENECEFFCAVSDLLGETIKCDETTYDCRHSKCPLKQIDE